MNGQGYAESADAPELDISGDAITVELWLKHDGQSDEDAVLVNKGTDGPGYRLSFVGAGEEPGLRFAIQNVDSDRWAIFSDSGQIDELRLWNVARTQPEIAADDRRDLTGAEEGLVAYFRFDEMGSTTAHSSAT